MVLTVFRLFPWVFFICCSIFYCSCCLQLAERRALWPSCAQSAHFTVVLFAPLLFDAFAFDELLFGWLLLTSSHCTPIDGPYVPRCSAQSYRSCKISFAALDSLPWILFRIVAIVFFVKHWCCTKVFKLWTIPCCNLVYCFMFLSVILMQTLSNGVNCLKPGNSLGKLIIHLLISCFRIKWSVTSQSFSTERCSIWLSISDHYSFILLAIR